MKHLGRLILESLALLVLCLVLTVALNGKLPRSLTRQPFTYTLASKGSPNLTPRDASAGSSVSEVESVSTTETTEKKIVTGGDQGKSYPGFTLYSTSGTAEIVLANEKGEFVHRWDVDADRARLLPNCNVLVVHGSKWGLAREPWSSLRSVIREYDWEGKIAWEASLPSDAHHDIWRMKNGHTLVPYLTRVPRDIIVQQLGPDFKDFHVRSDVIVELDGKGETVWEWKAHEHLSISDCGARGCPEFSAKYREGHKRFDWTHINTARPLPDNKWFEGGDKRFAPGNVLVFPRNFWSALIIDRTTKEVVWRYSAEKNGGLSGGHEAYMIENGLPGAGNILIFDNGRVGEESRVLEVNPITEDVVWEYHRPGEFFSRVAGAAQRLPNGNTLISEDTTGRVFEVTSDGTTVWSHQAYKLRINRANRYPEGYCAERPEMTKSS
ncbi:MAG: aryl-sulfate sulfotransferase [Bdellovibrionales bacterium]|nr:aryl-sulfate sulfotransferase [Bdellovibrionales bacterium]